MQQKSNRIIVTVIGQDQVGIIADVSTVLAEAGANIVDISQTTLQRVLRHDHDGRHRAGQPCRSTSIKRRLNAKGDEMGLRIDAQHEDVFKFMHRV